MRIVIYTREAMLLALLALSGVAALPGCGGKPAADDPPAAAASSPPASTADSSASAPAPAVSRSGNLGAASSETNKESPAAGQPPGRKLISDTEAQEFVSSLDKALTAGDAKALGEMFDDEAMMGKAMAKLGLPPETAESFVRGSMKLASEGQGEGGQFAARVAKGDKFRLLHVHMNGNWQCGLFRLFDNEGHMNYTDFMLARGADDKVRISDYYDYGFAELHTLVIQRAIQCKLIEDDAEAAQRTPAMAEYAKHRAEMDSVTRLIYDKKYSEALAIYEKLPEGLKKSRIGLILRVSACHTEKDQCDDMVRTFREKFPNDSGLDLFMGQYHTALRRWDEALAGIEALDKQLGGDPYLDAERAQIQLAKGNLAAAKRLLQKSLSAEPDALLVRELQKQVAEFENHLGSGTTAAEESPGKPASDDEAKAFAEQFVKCVMSGDAEGIQKCIDVGSFYRRATATIDIPAEIKLALEASFRSGYGAQIGVGFRIEKEQLDKGASLCLLRLHTRNGEQRAVFRHVSADGGFALFDCILERHSDGTVRIADYYDLNGGGMKSELYGLLLSDSVKKYRRSPGDAPPPQSNDSLTFASAYLEMQKRFTEGRHQEALDFYKALPAVLQKEKHILLVRIHAAKQLAGESYDQAIRDYREAFPTAPNLDVIMVDAYTSHKLYDRVLASIDGLDRKIGGDPYLDVLRCEAYVQKKDLNSARRLARKAVEADPNTLMAYKLLLIISLRQKKYAETSALLTTVQKLYPHCAPDVQSDADYRDFLKSSQYRTWAKRQADKG